jgi:N-acetylneuraminic acid mutarotase
MLHLVSRFRPMPRCATPVGVAVLALALHGCDDSQRDPVSPLASQTSDTERQVGAEASNSWITRASMPTGRYGLTAAAVNNAVFAIGGVRAGGGFTTKVEAYNATTNSWSTKASLPAARAFTSGSAAINGLLYVPGGEDGLGGETKTLFVYNPSTNSWTKKADMPVFSANGATVAINGKLYVFSPFALNGLPALHRYDPSTNTWTPLKPPPREHWQPAGAGVINGKFYVAGGTDANGTTAALDVYDPATNNWTSKAPMPTKRSAGAGRVINGKLYVVGGLDAGSNISRKVEVYNAATNTWATKASMPAGRYLFGAAGMNGILYAVGNMTKNEAYTP